MDERWAAALLATLAERTPKDVMHEMMLNTSAKEAQVIVEGVQWARELLAQ